MEVGFLAAMTVQGGDIAEIARATEAAGFDSLWIPEHPVIPAAMKTMFPFTDSGKLPEHYGRWADPFIGLAATVTKRLKRFRSRSPAPAHRCAGSSRFMADSPPSSPRSGEGADSDLHWRRRSVCADGSGQCRRRGIHQNRRRLANHHLPRRQPRLHQSRHRPHSQSRALSYNKLADERSWNAMKSFFEEIFA